MADLTTTPFLCGHCGETPAGLEPLGNGTVARYCSSCGNTHEEFNGTPEERLDAAERAFDLALSDLRSRNTPNLPGWYEGLNEEDKALTRTTLLLGRYDNARFELTEARRELGLAPLTTAEENAR